MNYVTMHLSQFTVISILTVSLITGCNGEQKQTDPDSYMSQLIADLWLEGADVLRIIWRDCTKKVSDFKQSTLTNKTGILIQDQNIGA